MTPCVAKLKTNPLVSRLTNQRKIILEYLKCVRTHPTAQTIYKDVKKKLPQLSLGTVYRNLNFLVNQGFVLALKSINDCVHYDGQAQNHPHLICEKCGLIFDLEEKRFAKIIQSCKKTKHGQIEKCRLNFYGTCHSCGRKERIKKYGNKRTR